MPDCLVLYVNVTVDECAVIIMRGNACYRSEQNEAGILIIILSEIKAWVVGSQLMSE